MRQIKFRAWHPKLRYFIYFKNLNLIHHSKYFLESQSIENVVYHYWDKEVPIQQYTGLKDKNGKEIYEGDIIKNECDEIIEVKFEISSNGHCFGHGEYGNNIFAGFSLLSHGKTFEVIGNIFQNLELLK